MGLDILTARIQELRKNPALAKSAGWLNIADVVCLDAFLKTIAVNLTAITQFKALIVGLRGAASQALSAAQLILAQIEVTLSTLNTFVSAFGSAKTQAVGSISPFPFKSSEWSACNPVQKIKLLASTAIPTPDPSSILPGNAGKFAKKFKMTLKSIREYKYRIFKLNKRVKEINLKIAELQTLIIVMDTILEAIEQQFGV